MEFLSGIFVQFGVWLWFALAVILLVLETIVPGIHFVWFGMAATIVGALALVVPMHWTWQVIIFTLISVATVFWVRRASSGTVANPEEKSLNVRGAQYIGRRVTVEDAIRNGRGKVRVGDTVWSAEGEDAPAGTKVEVTGVNGTVLVVAKPD